MSPQKGEVDGCGTGILVFLLAGAALVAALLAPGAIYAQGDWNKSSIVLSGQCLPDGTAEFTVTNTGRDMAGASAWREYEADALAQSGEFTLKAGAAQVWTFASNGIPIRFEADQRPWHPGSSAPNLTLTCPKPTAVGLRSFTATSSGNRGGCAAGNKLRGLACTVTAFTPGYVSGECDGGYWFSKVSTARTFRLDQAVTVQGCIGIDLRLAGATSWPLRISK